MNFTNKIKNKINNSVVRIIAEDININWQMPYLPEVPSKGQGTGFFINKNGYILTCAHVVKNAKNIYIEIPNKNTIKYKCDLISICPSFDIAIIKTKKYNSKYYLELGNSDEVEVGSKVYIVGYPVSYKKYLNSVNNIKYTMGIVNGQQDGLIQSDAVINPGNSGGPLFYGNKVIGINSNKLTGNTLEGIGYAVPINNYKIIENNIGENIIYRPKLLFEYDNTNDELLQDLTNGKIKHGIIVSKIYENSILKNSNIKKDCIITEINKYKINNNGMVDCKWLFTNININILINKFKNNSTIKIKYYCDNKVHEENIILKPYIGVIREIFPVFEKVPYLILGGIIFMNFSENNLAYLDKTNIELLYTWKNRDDYKKSKIFISFILPNTKANKLNNIKAHDFVEKINNINVYTLDNMVEALNKPLIINGKEYIRFDTSNYNSYLVSIEEIIKDDLIFSEIYKYPLNEFHKKYIKKLMK
jgi:S1-C subfamily serine protease